MTNERYQNKKDEAKKYYFSIGEVYCPTLRREVAFSRDGWNDILRKGRKHRTIPDQLRRFNLLRHAVSVLKSLNPRKQFFSVMDK